MKNRILLENYSLPGGLERQIGAFVDYYNNRRYHESLGNLSPADVYHGSGEKILKMRKEIKKQTLQVGQFSLLAHFSELPRQLVSKHDRQRHLDSA